MGCVFSSQNGSNISESKKWTTPTALMDDFPSTLRDPNLLTNVAMLLCESSRTKGGRSYMEDIDIIYDKYSIHNGKDYEDDASVSLFGVFDGHGGTECAAYVSKQLPISIFHKIKLNTANRSTAEIIYRSYLDIDMNWLISSDSQAGSTCTLFLWRTDESRGYISHVGDSRAVLCRAGNAVDITRDHKPTDADIAKAIYENGGYIDGDRINGQLGKCFGDSYLKKPIAPADILSCSPDIVTYTPQSNDGFVVIASDGLWDVLSSSEVIARTHIFLRESGIYNELRISRGYLRKNRQENILLKVKEFAYTLARFATVQLRSRDNITVMIILLVKQLSEAEALGDVYCEDVDTAVVARQSRGELDDVSPSNWLPVEVQTSYSDEAF